MSESKSRKAGRKVIKKYAGEAACEDVLYEMIKLYLQKGSWKDIERAEK